MGSKRLHPQVLARARARRLPAMPPEQWSLVHDQWPRTHLAVRSCAIQLAEGIFGDHAPALLRLAAIALHGQPFGVPEHSVNALRHHLASLEVSNPNDPNLAPLEELLAFAESLLPPPPRVKPAQPRDRKPHLRLRVTQEREEGWLHE